MSLVIISRRPFSRGSEIAEKVAQQLGYRCIAREVLFDTAKKFGLDDAHVLQAIHDAPSFSDHFHYGRERYVAFYQAALLEVLRQDNVVYHGLAGHFFVQTVRHALKVRIITSLEERVRLLTSRENIGLRNAARIIKKEDNDRRRWSRHLYGVDTWDPDLYNMVLNIEDFTVAEAVEIICRTLEMERFQVTPESRQHLDDLTLAARIKAVLVQTRPDVQVSAKAGQVKVTTAASEKEEAGLRREMEVAIEDIDGIVSLDINFAHRVRHHD